MTVDSANEHAGDDNLSSLGAPQVGYYVGPDSGCPPEYADVPIRDLMAQLEAERRDHAAEPEGLAAGFWPRSSTGASATPIPPRGGSGFESGGVLDTSPPDGPLAGLTDAVTRDGRLAELGDDELIGVMRAWRRLKSWCSAGTLAAVAELARRRPADQTPAASPGQFPAQLSEFISDEVAAALTLTGQAASVETDLALDLAIRLPGTFDALHAGIIDDRRAGLIADATRILTDEHARLVEARILPKAGEQATGRLRAALARAVIAVDPAAATRRREEAQKDPRVRRWQEDAGTAALAGYNLPPAEVLQADQRLTERARALREAGLPGSLEELRARAYLDTLLGHSSAPELAEPSERPAGPARPKQPVRPQLATRVNLTLPLGSALGQSDQPGVIAGFGPVDAPLARHLLGAAAADPATRYCITLTGQNGQAIAHGCLPGPDALNKLTTHNLTQPLTLTITPLAQGLCGHRHQEPGYQPSRKLQHLIWARNPACTAPGCQRPAARCDLDHTTPYDQGGRTCECNLAPLCRRHHRCKQSCNWHLEQPSPGTMHWTTPAGRHYITEPNAYP
jgi:hypothetical protein